MRMTAILFFLFYVNPLWGVNPGEKLTLEDIYQKRIFREQSIEGFRWTCDDDFFTELKTNAATGAQYIIKFETKTGFITDTLLNTEKLTGPEGKKLSISDYKFGPKEQKILLMSGIEHIFRRSTKAVHYIYDFKTKKLTALTKGRKESFATFSPNGNHVAFVRNNNLLVKDLESGKVWHVTSDGLHNHMINGMGDWVYEEEFSLSKAFCWSPDGKRIAFFVFDESRVKEYCMQMWGSLYPKGYRFKYPKAGEQNSLVSIRVYNLEDKSAVTMDTGMETDIYIPRIKWLPDGQKLSIIRMNRLQNVLEIMHADVLTGKSDIVYREESDTYIDLEFTDDLTYLSDGSFVMSSERDGYKHIYYYTPDGNLIRQITKGNWEVGELVAVDQKRKMLFYLSTEDSPLERQLYKIGLNGKHKTKIRLFEGVNHVEFSNELSYFVNENTSASSPLKVTLNKSNGSIVRVLEDNERLRKAFSRYGLTTKEFFSFVTGDGILLNGYMLKPSDFDPAKKYPVLMQVYGGPGSQSVQNNWEKQYWHQLLVQNGYIIVSVDNRGTGGRGRAFKHCTYKQLGKLESVDQIEAAKYLGTLPYIDPNRIGIWGWSYGGYMAALSLFTGHMYFKAAISVAPVTSWRFYDTIYTERYLQRPQDNPDGYDDYTPIAHAAELTGSFLLIHGTGDDNVHFQNSVELQRALILAGKQFRSFYYPDKNHGIYGGNTRYHLFKMMTDFVLEKL